MAGKFKFELDHGGAEELLKTPELTALIRSLGDQCAANASSMSGGLEYKSETAVRGDRVTARVSPDSVHAYYSNRKNNTLVKALGSVHA